jgi:pimeloyl-ACP methyl ester carboxylesterase
LSTSTPDAAAVTGPTEPDEMGLLARHAAEIGAPAARAASVTRVNVEVDGHRVSGLTWGEGRPGVVFLHGGGQNAHTWDAVLLRTGYPALALDLPGHGWSDWMPGGVYLPRRVAPVVAGGIRALAGKGPIPVVGMSLGGLTGICLAAWHPDMVSQLVIVDVSPGGRPERSRPMTDFSSVTSFASFDSLLDQARSFRPQVPEEALRRSLFYNARSRPDGTWVWRHDRRDPPGEGRFDRIFADLPSYWEVAAQIKVPTYVIVGDRSPIVTPADVERYRREIPGIEIIDAAGAGHSVQGDRPDLVIDVVDRIRTR